MAKKSQPNSATAPATITDIKQAWVQLFDDKSFKDRRTEVKGKENVAKLKTKKFGDKTSSVKWQIPKGWSAVLYDDVNYKDSYFALLGTGKVAEESDLGSFSDKASSLRWERVK